MLAGNGEISSEKSHCSARILNVNYTIFGIDESQHQLCVIRIREIFEFRAIARQGVDNEGTVTYTFRSRKQRRIPFQNSRSFDIYRRAQWISNLAGQIISL